MVGEAENGAQALLRLASELQPDFLLLDVQLPDLDGFEVTARLLEAADGGSPAVILTSSRDGSEFGSLVAQSGALGFVPKGELSGASSEACLTSTAMARLRVALWPLALLAGFGALGIYITSNHDDEAAISRRHHAPARLVVLALGPRRLEPPAWEPVRPLMVAAGFAWFLTSLTAANGSIHTRSGRSSRTSVRGHRHVLLAYPRGRLEVVGHAGYRGERVRHDGRRPVPLPPVPRADGQQVCGCPANALLVTPNDGLADSLEAIGRISAVVLTLAVAVIYAAVARSSAAGPPHARPGAGHRRAGRLPCSRSRSSSISSSQTSSWTPSSSCRRSSSPRCRSPRSRSPPEPARPFCGREP